MTHTTVTPPDAKELLESGAGWTYVDVRTVEEFQRSHAPGAFNVPIALAGPGGMTLNEDFLAVMESRFAKDAKLILGCAAGIRSERACEALTSAGYAQLVNMNGGFSGRRDPSGRVVVEGWQGHGFECEAQAPLERTYAGLLQALR
jgi:rhodanese-related sulfurtransferase